MRACRSAPCALVLCDVENGRVSQWSAERVAPGPRAAADTDPGSGGEETGPDRRQRARHALCPPQRGGRPRQRRSRTAFGGGVSQETHPLAQPLQDAPIQVTELVAQLHCVRVPGSAMDVSAQRIVQPAGINRNFLSARHSSSVLALQAIDYCLLQRLCPFVS